MADRQKDQILHVAPQRERHDEDDAKDAVQRGGLDERRRDAPERGDVLRAERVADAVAHGEQAAGDEEREDDVGGDGEGEVRELDAEVREDGVPLGEDEEPSSPDKETMSWPGR